MATAGLAEAARSAVVEKASDYTLRWSDHAPVTCTFEWEVAAVPGQRGPVESTASAKTAEVAADS